VFGWFCAWWFWGFVGWISAAHPPCRPADAPCLRGVVCCRMRCAYPAYGWGLVLWWGFAGCAALIRPTGVLGLRFCRVDKRSASAMPPGRRAVFAWGGALPDALRLSGLRVGFGFMMGVCRMRCAYPAYGWGLVLWWGLSDALRLSGLRVGFGFLMGVCRMRCAYPAYGWGLVLWWGFAGCAVLIRPTGWWFFDGVCRMRCAYPAYGCAGVEIL